MKDLRGWLIPFVCLWIAPGAIALDAPNSLSYWTELCTSLQEPGKYPDALTACDAAIKLNNHNPALWLNRGQILSQLGKPAEAIASINVALKLRPDSSLALLQRCLVQAQMGNPEMALKDCDRAITLDRQWDGVAPTAVWLQRGMALRRLGQLEAALTAYDRALDAQPNSSAILTEKCATFLDGGKDQQAADTCDLAIRLDRHWEDTSPSRALTLRATALTRLGQSNRNRQNCQQSASKPSNQPSPVDDCARQSREQQYTTALQATNQAIARNPNNPLPWSQQGITLMQMGRHQEALTAQDWAVKLSPNFSLALANRCAALNALGRFADALTTCDQALQADGRWEGESPAIAWNQRGVALAGQSRWEEALSSLDRALVLRENDADIWNNRGVVLWHRKQYEDALIALEKTVQLQPDRAQAHFNRGRVLSSLDRQREAIAAYDRALQGDLPPQSVTFRAEVLTNRSVAAWKQKWYAEAFESARQATVIDPTAVAAWYNRGVALSSMGRNAEAAEAYTEATQLAPDQVALWLALGQTLKQLGRSQEALATYDRAIALSPTLVEAWHPRGLLLTTLQRYDEALAAYDQAIALNPRSAALQAERGMILLKLDQHQAALSAFIAALSIDPGNGRAKTGKNQAQQRLRPQDGTPRTGQSTPSGDNRILPNLLP